MAQCSIPKDAREVWINGDPKADLLATFVDSKGRKQYRYHARVIRQRETRKFRKVRALKHRIKRVRLQVRKDLGRKRLSREKVIALVVGLIDAGYFRVGSKCYALENGTYGISTLLRRHVSMGGEKVVFEFVGKKQVGHRKVVGDAGVVPLLQELAALPGCLDSPFFVYRKAGNLVLVSKEMINGYLRRYRISAKDFRTYHATRLCAQKLLTYGLADRKRAIRRNIRIATEETARELGHTAGICRRSYIDPLLLKVYSNGNLKRVAQFAEHTGGVMRKQNR